MLNMNKFPRVTPGEIYEINRQSGAQRIEKQRILVLIVDVRRNYYQETDIIWTGFMHGQTFVTPLSYLLFESFMPVKVA